MAEQAGPSPEDKFESQEIGPANATQAERPAEIKPAESQPRTAENVGAERYEKAKAWMSGKYVRAKEAVGKAAGFLGRLGIKMLAPDVMAADAAAAGKQKYEHVSASVKEKAQAASQRVSESWGSIVEKKNAVCEGVRERYNGVVESARAYRDGVVSRIQDAKLKAEMAGIQRQIDKLMSRIDKTDRLTDNLASRREALQSGIAQVSARLEGLRGQSS